MPRSPLALFALLSLFASACPQPEENPPASGTGGKGGAGGGTPGRTGGSGGNQQTGGSGGTGGSTPQGGAGAGGSAGGGGDAGGETGPAPDGGGNADCATAPNSLLCKPLGKMPMSIKDTGFFPMAPDFTKRSPRLIEFVPDPPLWSDGMEKQRFILLPAGTKVNNTDRKNWVFPMGTLISKTFFDDGGPGGKTRPIETRFIRKNDSPPWEFYVYKWNADGTDATLIVNDMDGDPNKGEDVMITINHMSGGKQLMLNNGRPFPHNLPSRNACGECHEENGMVGSNVIGFDELRLNTKLTPTSAKTQLAELADKGIFTAALPAQPLTIADANPLLLRVKKFIFGNCVHCHNGMAQTSFQPEEFVKNTVNVKVEETQSVKPPPGMLRIWGKDIRKSVLYVQAERTMLPPPYMADGMEYRLRPMPPVGVTIADLDALKDLRDWIATLPAPPPGTR